ncbi:vacuolar-type H+-ATPase subunit I/STV1 [Hydrogenophaga palleronii]|uniref:Vacuolar-type H+-ATPase subunit I/STV1 n=1 Tax=Hydrogenophaga palleronii TaxID=65655 RepID=A0ABU1WUP5_9BURK|nr:DUF4124 domain-containing protein [Hydrogenophaga palleronii]MDR7152582.1 vacuolar-type H+-ATPase subunit I/STV1 [Hydrogenophaga palleronii]
MPLAEHTSSRNRSRALGLSLLLGVTCVASAQTQGQSSTQSIYTCVDGNGRRITSDRPIKECLDREQRELGSSGTVRRVVPPSYTAEERARIAAQRRAEELEISRANEERRRERALLIRYPNQAVHDRARAEALSQVDEVMGAVKKREETLAEQRKQIDAELDFYQGDREKAPSWLRRKLEDNEEQVFVQKRFLDEQTKEKQRINARFEEELGKLRQLWATGSTSGSATLSR